MRREHAMAERESPTARPCHAPALPHTPPTSWRSISLAKDGLTWGVEGGGVRPRFHPVWRSAGRRGPSEKPLPAPPPALCRARRRARRTHVHYEYLFDKPDGVAVARVSLGRPRKAGRWTFPRGHRAKTAGPAAALLLHRLFHAGTKFMA